VTLPAGTVCPFPVGLTFPTNRERAVTFAGEHGGPYDTIITGAVVARVTNLATGAALTASIAGPVFIADNGGGALTVTLRGRALVYTGPGAAIAPALLLTSGTVVLRADAATGGILAIDRVQGGAEDACAPLAG
jgi:hypothetical protein